MAESSTGTGPILRPVPASAPRRVIAIFAGDPASARRAVRHVSGGTQKLPVWLYTTATPPDDLAILIDRVTVHTSPWKLLLVAQRELWPLRSALSVGVWNGARTGVLKLLPLLIPPFRTLFLNRSGDFLPGTPLRIAAHCFHTLRERLHDLRVRGGEIVSDLWSLLTYHIWRSGPVTRAKHMAGALGLWLLATLLRLSAYPHRRIFPRIHGSQPLPTPTIEESDANEVVCFHQSSRDWDPKSLAELVNSTSARFVVWHNGSDPGVIGDLLPIFDDPATFAVSRQGNFRAWKNALLPTSPFRALQPGECTRLLAPLGPSIVVDRRKLAALTIPDVSHPKTAWMLLFWKAAAAGWNSYCAGGSEPGSQPNVSVEPDFPVDEAAFLLQVMRDPQLRVLGPREPLLSRGNLAFSPAMTATRRGECSQPRILIVSPFLPYPLSHGGAVRIYNLCRALAGRARFGLVAVREHGEAIDYANLHSVFEEVRILDIDQTTPTVPDWPEQVRRHECPALRAAISALCRTWRPDVVQFEYTQTAALRDAAAGICSVLVEHDITFSLYRQLAETSRTNEARREFESWHAFESRCLAEFDAVHTVSETDRELAIQTGRRDPAATWCVPNGVDTARFRPSATPATGREVLYVGSFRHLPNLLAFDHLRDRIMPLVWQRYPDALLRVVAGPKHRYFWERFDSRSHSRPLDARIAIHDFVEDLRPLYAQAAVVTAPLLASAGTNIKIMEAMACGNAIVSTPSGCAGLELRDGCDLLVRTGPAEFAAGICDLLSDPSARAELGRQARQTVENRFSWTAIAEAAWDSYGALQGKRSVAVSAR